MFDLWFQHLSSGLNAKSMVVYMWHPAEDRFQWAGDMYKTLGLQQQDYPLSNAQFHKLINPQHVPERLSSLHDLMKGKAGEQVPQSEFSAKYKIRRANGTQVDVEETASLQVDQASGKKVVCGFLKFNDETQLEKPNRIDGTNLALASEDAGMTHYGRIVLCQKIDEWAETQAMQGQNRNTGYLLVVGIDRLSLMNEAFGARYADEMIEKTGERLRQVVGTTGYVSRIDGDVYGLFFHQAPYTEMAAVAQYILNNFYANPVETSKGPIGVSVSIGGISVNQVSSRDIHSLLTKAEMAMRAAKDQGRGSFLSYGEAVDEAVNHRFLLETADEFMDAVKDNRIKLAFQPIINMESQAVSFHESLIRMIDENGKLLPAGDFVPAIEKLGLSRLVDQLAMRMAIQELSLFPELTLTVNVSHLTLNNPDWLRGLVAALRDKPSVAKRLVLEVTETAMADDPKHTLRVIKTVKDLGCKVALDDFGAGYTAFSQIREMEVDIVKIDKSYVRNMDDAQNRLFIKTLQSLADGVNVETIGEGAETMADARQLASDGVNYVQGYVYGFPRVERLWLPKNHIHREIALLETDKIQQSEQVQVDSLKDIELWKQAN